MHIVDSGHVMQVCLNQLVLLVIPPVYSTTTVVHIGTSCGRCCIVAAETDRQEIQQETQRQDRVIDDIGNAVASLHTLSKVRWHAALLDF
jgi:hypothetical protein